MPEDARNTHLGATEVSSFDVLPKILFLPD